MPTYRIEIEIYQGNGDQLQKDGDMIIYPDFATEGICAWMYHGDGLKSYQVGQRFAYPQETGMMCPWLLDSLRGIVATLRYDGTLPWLYRGTPYEKVIDPQGITTEFVRCPDPTASGIVVKIIRTWLPE